MSTIPSKKLRDHDIFQPWSLIYINYFTNNVLLPFALKSFVLSAIFSSSILSETVYLSPSGSVIVLPSLDTSPTPSVESVFCILCNLYRCNAIRSCMNCFWAIGRWDNSTPQGHSRSKKTAKIFEIFPFIVLMVNTFPKKN